MCNTAVLFSQCKGMALFYMLQIFSKKNALFLKKKFSHIIIYVRTLYMLYVCDWRKICLSENHFLLYGGYFDVLICEAPHHLFSVNVLVRAGM